MPENPDSQNSNQLYSRYTSGGYEKAKLRKLLLVVVGIFLIIALVVSYQLLRPESQQTKYIKAATAAARKQIPNAQVTHVKVAGGFASSIVSDPTAEGQANSGNETIFKVTANGSMIQLANGSDFGPLDLLQLGIPLATQAELAGSTTKQVEQKLASQCGYEDGSIGFDGFDGSFNPGGWEIDAATLSNLEQKLTTGIGSQNTSSNPVICVNTTQKNSNLTTNKTTYISTFTLQVQFVTKDGTLATHTVTFAIGPNNYRNYTLDGQSL